MSYVSALGTLTICTNRAFHERFMDSCHIFEHGFFHPRKPTVLDPQFVHP